MEYYVAEFSGVVLPQKQLENEIQIPNTKAQDTLSIKLYVCIFLVWC